MSLSVKTRFIEGSETYDIQYIIAEGNQNRFEKNENPKRIDLNDMEEAFVFSYDQYGEFCCLMNFNKKKGKHECKVLISKY
jgi:hypothetical protein